MGLVRAATPGDHPWILALNTRFEVKLSPLDGPRLSLLAAAAFRYVAVDPEAAFLLAFAPGASYDSPNFRWFEARGNDFVYVDRVVVNPSARGRGLARALYEDLMAAARAAGLARIVCEVNSDPPNPGSDAFHAALGFEKVGEARLGNGKSVRYLARAL